MGNESKVEIKIGTSADVGGVQKTDAALKQLDTTASKTANSIQAALEKTAVAEKSRTDDARAGAQEQAQIALREIKSREDAAAAATKAKDKLTDLGKATKDVSKLGNDLSQVLEGLSRGDMAGLALAGRGAKDALGTIAAAASGVLLPALVAVGGVFVIFKSALDSIGRETARYFKDAATASDRYKSQLEKNTAANAKALETEAHDIEKIAAAYDAVTAAIDRAYAAQQKIDAAKAGLASEKLNNQEKQELAKARTPEEEAAIKQKFSDRRLVADTQQKFKEFDTVDKRADVDTRSAHEAQQKAASENSDIQALREAAKKKADDLTQTAGTLEAANGATGPTLKAQADAKAARKAYDDLVKGTDEKFKANDQTFSKSQGIIDSAKSTREENAVNRDKFREELKGKQLDNSLEEKGTRKAIIDKTNEAQTLGGVDPKEITALRTKLAALQGTDKTLGGLLGQDTKNQSTENFQKSQRALAGVAEPQSAAGTIIGPDGKIRIVDRNLGKGGITDSQGNAIALDKLTKQGQGKATLDAAAAAPAIVSSNAELIAALNANTAALQAAAGGGSGGSTTAKAVGAAADKNAKSGDKLHDTVISSLDAQSNRNEATSRKLDEINRKQRAKDDRS